MKKEEQNKKQERERAEYAAWRRSYDAGVDSSEESAASDAQTGFSFPTAFYDDNLNRWERGEISLGVARYQCMSTGEIRNLDRLDIERLERTPGFQVEY